MKNVPHWQLFIVIYFILVAVPVYMVNSFLKKRVLAQKSFINLLIYFAGVLGSAFIMHFISMWIYFTFFFSNRN